MTATPSRQQGAGERKLVLNQPDGRSRTGNEHGSPPDAIPLNRGGDEPGWAAGLRKLYNTVVEEPLPDSFKDLLKKLDDSDDA